MNNEDNTPYFVVIDDNKISVKVCTVGLTQRGINVRGFTDPNEGVEFVLQHNVNVAAIDLVMKPIDGFEVLKQIKHHNPNTICIAMSASASSNDNSLAKEAGFDELLVKPFNTQMFLEKVECLLSEKQQSSLDQLMLSESDSRMLEEQLIHAKTEFNQACINLEPNEIMDACHKLRECAVLAKFPSIKASIEDIQKAINLRQLNPIELVNLNHFIQAHLG